LNEIHTVESLKKSIQGELISLLVRFDSDEEKYEKIT
jgi:hypothetical protein